MTSLFRMAVIAASLSGLSACALTPERNREARLMPAEVALQIVTRYSSESWAKNPVASGILTNGLLCDDKTPHPMPYESMNLTWDAFGVEIHGDHKVSFWCGSYTGLKFRISDVEGREDLIDALTSLGAKTKLGRWSGQK
ncbi:MAG: hypothetical protein JW384_02892 [Nitrosomonadaceae bacterium]|nr:hypothetical protein [Nitrosomonadaceae bacterium]